MKKHLLILGILIALGAIISGCSSEETPTGTIEGSPVEGAWKNLYFVDNDIISDYWVATRVTMLGGNFTTEFFFDSLVTGIPFIIKIGTYSYSRDTLYLTELDPVDSSVITEDILQFRRIDSLLRMSVVSHIECQLVDTVADDTLGIFWPARAPSEGLGSLGEADLGTFEPSW